jgi:hypothetical protein
MPRTPRARTGRRQRGKLEFQRDEPCRWRAMEPGMSQFSSGGELPGGTCDARYDARLLRVSPPSRPSRGKR